jgi:hypothetical protein
MIVATEVAAMITSVLPRSIADKNMPGFSFRLFSRSANLTSVLSKCLTRILLMDMIAVSALEKKADRMRQTKIMTKYKVCELSIYIPEHVPEYVYHTIRYVRSQRKSILRAPGKQRKRNGRDMIK